MGGTSEGAWAQSKAQEEGWKERRKERGGRERGAWSGDQEGRAECAQGG